MTSDPVLHGHSVSNWFNCARAAMIEKGMDGRFVPVSASAEPEFLEQSAMGKVPWLETARGGLAETVAILEFLEETVDGPALMPTGAFERGRVRQIVNIAQVYIEVPMRALYPCTFMGEDAALAPMDSSFETAGRAMRALDRLCEFAPFLHGNSLTLADLVAFYVFEVANRVAWHLRKESLFDGRPCFQQWDAVMRQRESTRVVLADFAPAFAEYRRAKGAAFDEAQYQSESLSHA